MAKSKNKGINVITIIVILILIIITVVVTRKIIAKNNKNEQVNNVTNQIENDTEKNVKVLEDGTKLNVSSKLNENKIVGDLVIKDIQLTYKDGVTNLLCNIQNISNKKTDIQNVNIILLDEQGETIYTMQGIIEEIEAGETKQFNTSITADFANAYDFKIVKK